MIRWKMSPKFLNLSPGGWLFYVNARGNWQSTLSVSCSDYWSFCLLFSVYLVWQESEMVPAPSWTKARGTEEAAGTWTPPTLLRFCEELHGFGKRKEHNEKMHFWTRTNVSDLPYFGSLSYFNPVEKKKHKNSQLLGFAPRYDANTMSANRTTQLDYWLSFTLQTWCVAMF